jgi:hypothetical protein
MTTQRPRRWSKVTNSGSLELPKFFPTEKKDGPLPSFINRGGIHDPGKKRGKAKVEKQPSLPSIFLRYFFYLFLLLATKLASSTAMPQSHFPPPTTPRSSLKRQEHLQPLFTSDQARLLFLLLP